MKPSAAVISPAAGALRDDHVVTVRRLCSGDGDAVQAFVRALSPAAKRMRFFAAVRELAPWQIERMTNGTDRQDVSFAAFRRHESDPRILALAECVATEGEGEFGLAVADDCTRQGLGRKLLELLLAHAAQAGLSALAGLVLPENEPMLALAAALGFHFLDAEDGLIRVWRPLAAVKAFTWHHFVGGMARNREVALS